MVVNNANNNDGSCLAPGLRFGLASGEGIASPRICGSLNQFGLTFYTKFEPRMNIAQCGGICVHNSAWVHGNVQICKSLTVGAFTGSCYPFQAGGLTTKIAQFKRFSSLACADRSAVISIQNSDCTIVDWNLGVSGVCNPAKVPDGSFYIKRCGLCNIPIAINKCGYVGINNDKPIRRLCIAGRIQASCGVGVGTQTINTTLAVNGSIAAKVVLKSASYTMLASDYAVFESGSGAIVTLPPAKTQPVMMAFVKNTSSGSVTVKPGGTDNLEKSTAGVMLGAVGTTNSGVVCVFISDGASNWYVQSSSST